MSEKAYRRIVIAGVAFFPLVLLTGLSFSWMPAGVQALVFLACGWVPYLGRVLPRIAFNWEMIACGVTAVILGTWMLHRFLKWGWRHWKRADVESNWRPAWTVSAVALTLLLFVNATALTGIFHQAGWLFGKHTPLVYDSNLAIDSAAGATARGIYIGLLNYAGDHDGKFPDTLDQLVPDYFERPDSFQYLVDGRRRGTDDETQRYVYVRGLTSTSDGSAIVLYTPVPVGQKAIAVYLDGSVKSIPIEEIEEELWETEKIVLKNTAQ